MSNSSSSPGTSTDGSEFYSTEDQSPNQQPSTQEMMLQIHEMAQQSKCMSLLQVVQLSIQHIEQRKHITKLQLSLKKALEERVHIKRDLIVQHNFKTNVNNLELQKQSTWLLLREKLEAVHAHIKSNDVMRSHLKEDDMQARSEVDEIRKILADIAPKVTVFHTALKKGEAFVKDSSQQLSNAAVEKAKLQHECRSKEHEMRCAASSMAETVQKLKKNLVEKVNSIAQCRDVLQREQKSLDEQGKIYVQLQSELEMLQQSYEQRKQTVENELVNKMQHFEKQKELLEKQYTDMKAKDAEHIESLTRTLDNVSRENETVDKRIEILTSKRTELNKNLKNINDSNVELERELESYRRNKQQEYELARLKESAKATTKAVVREAPVTNKPNLLLNGRPKRLVFTKTSKKAPEKDETQAADPHISITSDSDYSCSFQNSIYFDGKY